MMDLIMGLKNKAQRVRLDSMNDIKDKIDKINNSSFKKAQKLIYKWVKTKQITFREFTTLCECNRNAI